MCLGTVEKNLVTVRLHKTQNLNSKPELDNAKSDGLNSMDTIPEHFNVSNIAAQVIIHSIIQGTKLGSEMPK